MKKLNDYSQFKEQENSPKAVNNETDNCIWQILSSKGR